MPELTPINASCSSCGQPFTAQIRTMINAQDDPQGKALLLTGRLNTEMCPNCGTPNAVAASLLYHDPEKELLIAHVPMELSLNKDQQEQVIGNMMNALPKENFKAYMFSPKRALTMQNLIEQVLEADGVTREMMDQQKERVQLVQQFVGAAEDQLEAMVKAHDAEIDEQFFQTMAMFTQRVMEDGRMDIAQRTAHIQDRIVQLSSAGKKLLEEQETQTRIIQEVGARLEALGEDATHEDFLNMAIEYAEENQHLQALVGLARPAFDYEWLQTLSVKIGEAPAPDRDKLTAMRDKVVELTQAIDQQSQAAMQQAANFLQALVNHPEPQSIIQANPHMIDDTLVAVIGANIQHAEQNNDTASAEKLKAIYNMIMSVMQSSMQPELVFVNELLSAKDEHEAKKMISARAEEFGTDLLEVMDAVNRVLVEQGQHDLQSRLDELRKYVAEALQ